MSASTPYSGPENTFDPAQAVEALTLEDMYLKIGSSAATISRLSAQLKVERRISEDRAAKLAQQAITISDKDKVIADMSAKIAAVEAQIETMKATRRGNRVRKGGGQ